MRLTGEDFSRLFNTFDRLAARLETRDSYKVDEERHAYHQFLAGEPYELDWFESWLASVRRLTAAGRKMQRVRLVSQPPSDYQRFELSVASTNLEAGEDIRILTQSEAADLNLPDYDFWLFDDDRLVVMHFDDDGHFLGAEPRNAPEMILTHRQAWASALARSTPYHKYITAHPTVSPYH